MPKVAAAAVGRKKKRHPKPKHAFRPRGVRLSPEQIAFIQLKYEDAIGNGVKFNAAALGRHKNLR